MDIESFVEFKRAQRDCYKLFAACFYQPQKELFLEEKVFENLGKLLSRACPEAAQFAGRMATSAMQYGNEELLVEYARLFIGPHELPAPPYGSVYLEEGGKVMGESTAMVMDFYKAEGLSMDEDFQNLPDHIAVELEFMYYLIYNEVEAVGKKDREKAVHFQNSQQAFRAKFLEGWIAPFCRKIKAGTENEFYRALADCLSAFISETNHGGIMPGALRENLARV